MPSRQKLRIADPSANGPQRKRARHSIRAFNVAPLEETVQLSQRLSLQRAAASSERASRRSASAHSSRSPPRRSRRTAAQEAMAAVQEHPINYGSLSQLAQLRSIYEQASAPTVSKPSAAEQSEWVSEAEIASERSRAYLSQSITVEQTQKIAPASARLIPTRPASRLARLRALMETFIRRLIAFLFPSKADRRTPRGQAALLQLQALADLLRAEFDGSGMDLVQYQVAFGESYFNVLQASRAHYKRHKGKGAEDYQPYFEDFLRQMP